MSRLSEFNYFQTRPDGHTIACNFLSGALALMTPENYAVFKSIAEKMKASDDPDFAGAERELVDQLVYGGFIYNGDDELYNLSFTHLMNRFNQKSLGLNIAPTMACNMACSYCRKPATEEQMSAATVEAILNYIEKNGKRLDHVDINWYGGEPLLGIDIIEDISESVFDIGDEFGILYSSSLITNGLLLSREMVDRLARVRISVIQVTLDGPAHIHDKKRPAKDGGPTFRTIIENLKYAATKFVIGLRINIDKSFTDETIAEVLSELKAAGLAERLGVNFGHIEYSGAACANLPNGCLNNAEFSENELAYYRLLHEHGFRIEQLPTPRKLFCPAQDINSFIIDPAGDLYRCYNYLGEPGKSCDNIRYEIDYTHPNFTRLFKFNPFEDETCRKCSLLPVCMGGCPARRADYDLKKEELCVDWKDNLPQMLEIIALSRQQQAQAAAAAKEQS